MKIKKKHEQILKKYIETLKYFNYSQATITSYGHYTTEFLNKTDKYHQHLVSVDVQEYLLNYNYTSRSQQNQVISALKFLYEKVLNKKYSKVNFIRPRKEKKLPMVIDSEKLSAKITAISNKKHKAILMLAYSCALRVSEVINLKIADIDSDRMLINIKNAKGKKDRIVKLSQTLLETLREYYKEYKPTEYLFNGQTSLQYSTTSCNKIIKKYIGQEYHFHTLRHSGATTMLEKGTDIAVIQKILGHKKVETTMIYTHISQNLIQQVQSPM